MGIDFDESGVNEEYDATEDEPTGELIEKPRPPRPEPIKPKAPKIATSLADLVAQMTSPDPEPVAAPVPQEELDQAAEEAYMAEVENRLDVAYCYKILLRDPLFDAENPTQASTLVEKKVRSFVRDQLGVLLGVAADKSPAKVQAPLLTERELEVVKALAEMTPIELTAIKLLATSAASKLGPQATAPAPRPAPEAPKKAPALAKRPTAPSPVNQGTALPAPQPAIQEQAKRGPGRPPGSKNKPKVVKVQAIRHHADGTEEPLFDDDGNPIEVKLTKRQQPAGALPFPTTSAGMAIATADLAGKQQQAGQRALQQESGAAGTLITAAHING